MNIYRMRFNIYEYAPTLFPKMKNMIIPLIPFNIHEEFCFYGMNLDKLYVISTSENDVKECVKDLDMTLKNKSIPLHVISNIYLMCETDLEHMYYSPKYSRHVKRKPKTISVFKSFMINSREIVSYARNGVYKEFGDDRLIYNKASYQDMMDGEMSLAMKSHLNTEIEHIIERAKPFRPKIVLNTFEERSNFVDIL